jgi:hypothetical protein
MKACQIAVNLRDAAGGVVALVQVKKSDERALRALVLRVEDTENAIILTRSKFNAGVCLKELFNGANGSSNEYQSWQTIDVGDEARCWLKRRTKSEFARARREELRALKKRI